MRWLWHVSMVIFKFLNWNLAGILCISYRAWIGLQRNGRHILRAREMWPGRNWLLSTDSTMDTHSKAFSIQGNYKGSVSMSLQPHPSGGGSFRIFESEFDSIKIQILFGFTFSLFRMRELGIQSREMNRLYTKRPVCSHAQSFESVRLIDCQIVLTILAYGFLISFIVFIAEKVMHARWVNSKVCLMWICIEIKIVWRSDAGVRYVVPHMHTSHCFLTCASNAHRSYATIYLSTVNIFLSVLIYDSFLEQKFDV